MKGGPVHNASSLLTPESCEIIIIIILPLYSVQSTRWHAIAMPDPYARTSVIHYQLLDLYTLEPY